MAPVPREDPYPGYNFQVNINGVIDDGKPALVAFSEVSGIEVEMTPIEYRTGTDANTSRKIPGLQKYTNVTLKRGVTASLEVWNWIVEAMNGRVRRTDGSIIMLDENRREVMRWTIKRAWPAKYTGPGLNAANNEIAIETLELAHEGLGVDGQTG